MIMLKHLISFAEMAIFTYYINKKKLFNVCFCDFDLMKYKGYFGNNIYLFIYFGRIVTHLISKLHHKTLICVDI